MYGGDHSFQQRLQHTKLAPFSAVMSLIPIFVELVLVGEHADDPDCEDFQLATLWLMFAVAVLASIAVQGWAYAGYKHDKGLEKADHPYHKTWLWGMLPLAAFDAAAFPAVFATGADDSLADALVVAQLVMLFFVAFSAGVLFVQRCDKDIEEGRSSQPEV